MCKSVVSSSSGANSCTTGNDITDLQRWHRSGMSPISASDQDRSEGDRYFFDLILSMTDSVLETSSDRPEFP
jgi:hypothetical protein